MLGNLLDELFCPICIKGQMNLSKSDTFDSYNQDFDLDDIDNLEESIIGQYWVFTCLECGAKQKMNFHDIEKMARRSIAQKVITLKAKAELDKTINMKVRYLVYCGMCHGYDSKGSCPQIVYDECQLRRIPCGL